MNKVHSTMSNYNYDKNLYYFRSKAAIHFFTHTHVCIYILYIYEHIYIYIFIFLLKL